MNSRIIINYSWQDAEAPKRPIRASHREALDETAQSQIGDMMQQGFTSGDLTDNIHMDEYDGDEGIPYVGHWQASTTKEPES